MHVVLFQPEIPPNTGNVARLCAATRTRLHLIEPLGFRLDEPALRRAGLDYWPWLAWQLWPDWTTFISALPAGARLWFIESHGPRRYTEVRYAPEDYLVFGRESAGLPRALLEANRAAWLRLPMVHPRVRSLNLATCVAVVLFEALRQLGFPGEQRSEPQT
ncbi:MAG: tRNA (cytidine(34)-2'-O)-methyltransferase [Verrucomicrobiota bacterium]|nr:tRNA (cytidine(34)-2'-O)-methyltransferase [Limisphaera sp.]MDW8382028.1 tRNA (cytidine(34)-2'-O)-methyltransferase [Verrucomicrobiota bacterium]